MSETPWTDLIVGERMTVDREFSSRIVDSRFSNQEWSLIMTATEFEIEHPEDPERARLVANTEHVDQILPELENVRSAAGAMGGRPTTDSRGGGGFVASIKSALGLGGKDGTTDEEREAAERLTQEYANELQAKLESKGRWDAVREAAAEG
ncbi:DUF5799 family protein [Halovivax sp.]|uniref:DUF5799 family protein n=1 Tax=Halovivax sp. TaxID=1935978 RepID=UPI0025BC3EF0|nr:DUF5799 family protein [Halovivax sp.]